MKALATTLTPVSILIHKDNVLVQATHVRMQDVVFCASAWLGNSKPSCIMWYLSDYLLRL